MKINRALAIIACALSIAPVSWHTAEAMSIGEIVSQSRLGEPLLVRVNLLAGPNEQVDDSCLSLAAPDARESDSSGFLTRASLSIAREGSRQYVLISTNRPFNDAYARIRLRIKCPGAGSITRTLTILPEADFSVVQPAIEPAPEAAQPVTPEIEPVKTSSPEKTETTPAPSPATKAAPRPAKRRPANATPAPHKTERTDAFRLKLSGEPLDASRIGKISAEERAALLAQQKLLDADDQTASFLALQHQVKQLQDELGQIKLQLAQLGTAPAASAPPSPAPATTPVPPPRPAVAKPVTPEENELYPQLLAAVGLLLAVLALWWGLRNHAAILERIRSRRKPAAALPQQPSPAPATPAQRVIQAHAAEQAPPIASPFKPGMDSEETVNLTQPAATETSEEDAMLEEARLYIAHGRPAKAIEILLDLTRRSPAKAEGWTLLLSLYSSLGNAEEFGNTAREFLKHHQDNPAWGNIQALGRTLDPDEPLYAGQMTAAARLLAGKQRQQIGDLLMEMGALSPQDLQHCLEDYNPEKHGRFGGYLVARKAITLEQLDQALLLQQGISPAMQAGELPSLQDMEKLLADFDPKRDRSVGAFLAARDAETTEQPDQAPPPQEAQPEQPRTAEQPLFEKHETLDFVLESSSEHPKLDLEFEPVTAENAADQELALDFEIAPAAPAAPVEPAAPAFPEITLDLDFGKSEEKKPEGQ